MPYLPELHSDEETFGWIAEVVLGEYETYVAHVDGAFAGFAAVSVEVLEHLYVAPEHQGLGVGSALLDQVKQARPDGFTLWVFQRNERARRFYESHGLRLVSLTDGEGNEEREPDALYAWALTA
jgi:ribosomal protein S18 acetylase RimI-like enzyme